MVMKPCIRLLTAGYIAALNLAFGQQPDTAVAYVKYTLVHVDDTNFRDNPRREDMWVHIGRHSSAYSSFTLASLADKAKREAGAKPGPQRFFFHSTGMTNETLYLYPAEKQAFVTDRLGITTYLIPQEYPQINWQVGTQTKAIGGYTCQQATGQFGGRTYTAWFTPELPFPYGPWKLHGLPGLILEASDDRNEVRFEYAGFDKEPDGGTPLAIPGDAIITTAKEFAKAKAAFEENPLENSLRSLDIPAGAKVERKIILKDENGREISPDELAARKAMAEKEGKIKKPNNPLELETRNR